MIIQALLDMIYAVFSVLTLPIEIPAMPEGVKETVGTMLEYIGTGIAYVGNFVNMPYLLVLFGIIVSVDAGLLVYRLVMWVIRKIPMLGVS